MIIFSGLSYKEISRCLETFYSITLSLLQLHWILRKQNLLRRYRKSSITEVRQAVQNLSGSAKIIWQSFSAPKTLCRWLYS